MDNSIVKPPEVPSLSPLTVAAMRLHLERECNGPARPVRRVRLSIVASAAAMAAVVAVLITLQIAGPGTAPAYASWSAIPVQPNKTALARAEATCRAQLPADAVGASLVVAEQRSTSFNLVFGGSSEHVWDCLLSTLSNDALPRRSSAISDDTTTASRLARPGQSLASFIGGMGEDTTPYPHTGPRTGRTTVYGRIGSNVKSVQVVLRDDLVVTATVNRSTGWWAAWYPEDELDPPSMLVTDLNEATRKVPVG